MFEVERVGNAAGPEMSSVLVQEEVYQAFRDYDSGNFQNPNDDVWAAA